MFKEEVIHATGNTQFGCGQPGGATALRHSLEAALLANPTKALLSIDIKNMHGSLEVDNTERQVLNNTPRLWPLVAPWIRSPRVHISRDDTGALHEILQRTLWIKAVPLPVCSQAFRQFPCTTNGSLTAAPSDSRTTPMCSQSPTRPRIACGKFPFQWLPWVAESMSGKPMRGPLRR